MCLKGAKFYFTFNKFAFLIKLPKLHNHEKATTLLVQLYLEPVCPPVVAQ